MILIPLFILLVLLLLYRVFVEMPRDLEELRATIKVQRKQIAYLSGELNKLKETKKN